MNTFQNITKELEKIGLIFFNLQEEKAHKTLI